jgi:hypothetical protein
MIFNPLFHIPFDSSIQTGQKVTFYLFIYFLSILYFSIPSNLFSIISETISESSTTYATIFYVSSLVENSLFGRIKVVDYGSTSSIGMK